MNMKHRLLSTSSIAFMQPTKLTRTPARYNPLELKAKTIMGSFESSSPTNDNDEAVATTAAAVLADLDLSKIEKFAHRTGDALFGYIEECQVKFSPPTTTTMNACFGNFLDAGTG